MFFYMEPSFIFTTPINIQPETKANDLFIEAYISTSGQDLVNDIVTENCLKSMLKQIVDRNIKLDFEHESFRGEGNEEIELNKTLNPVGRITGGFIDDRGLMVKAVLNKYHSKSKEIFGSVKDKFLDAMSIAFIPTKTKQVTKGSEQVRLLDDVKLLNVALTGNPVNTEAEIVSVFTKSLEHCQKGEPTKESENAGKKEKEKEKEDEEDEVKKYKKEKKNNPDLENHLEVKGDIETKPFGGFSNFNECVIKMEKEGHSTESAEKICGKIKEKYEKKAELEKIEEELKSYSLSETDTIKKGEKTMVKEDTSKKSEENSESSSEAENSAKESNESNDSQESTENSTESKDSNGGEESSESNEANESETKSKFDEIEKRLKALEEVEAQETQTNHKAIKENNDNGVAKNAENKSANPLDLLY